MDDHGQHKQRERHRQSDSEKERLWRQRLDGHKESGLGVRAYCRREEIGEPLFYRWRREIARRDAPGVAQRQRKKPVAGLQPSFAEVLPARQPVTAPAVPGRRELPCAPRALRPKLFSPTAASVSVASFRSTPAQPVADNSNAIEIVLRGGRTLRVARGFDPDLLLEVTRLLEGEAPSC